MHDIINYSTSICHSESGKSGKEEEKIQKFEYLENEKHTQALNIFHKGRTYVHIELKETKNITHFLLLQAHLH